MSHTLGMEGGERIRFLRQPFNWDVVVGTPFDVVAIAPLGIGTLRTFVQFLVRLLKDHPQI